jgi:hypothetical protein
MIETGAEVRATPIWWQRAVDAELKRQADIESQYKAEQQELEKKWLLAIDAYRSRLNIHLNVLGIAAYMGEITGVGGAVPIDGVLFRLSDSDTLYIVEYCPMCSRRDDILVGDDLASLGQALLGLVDDKRCLSCKREVQA